MGSNYADEGFVPVQAGRIGGDDGSDFDVDATADDPTGGVVNIVSGNARVGVQAKNVRGANIVFEGPKR